MHENFCSIKTVCYYTSCDHIVCYEVISTTSRSGITNSFVIFGQMMITNDDSMLIFKFPTTIISSGCVGVSPV